MGKAEIQFNWPVVGHGKIMEFLRRSIAGDKVAHAYLFYGPEHIGKTTVAENFAASLLCQEKEGNIPCGKCTGCRRLFKRIHPDAYFIGRGEGKKNISIEQIRELQQKLSLRSFMNSYKIALVEGAESMNEAASNAFLKTLEEPSEKTIIILVAQDISFFPRTILSRCQVFRFLPVPAAEISGYLSAQLKIGKIQADDLARLSLGRPGTAIGFSNDPESLQDYRREVAEFLEIAEGDLTGKFQAVGSLFKGNKFLENIDIFQKKLLIWALLARDAILTKEGAGDFAVNGFARADLAKLAGKYSRNQLAGILSEIGNTRKLLRQNANPQLAVENLLLRL